MIALGLRGLQIEQHAHEVMAYVADLSATSAASPTTSTRSARTSSTRSRSTTRPPSGLDRFETKLERAVEEHEELEGETVLELPGVSADAA